MIDQRPLTVDGRGGCRIPLTCTHPCPFDREGQDIPQRLEVGLVRPKDKAPASRLKEKFRHNSASRIAVPNKTNSAAVIQRITWKGTRRVIASPKMTTGILAIIIPKVVPRVTAKME